MYTRKVIREIVGREDEHFLAGPFETCYSISDNSGLSFVSGNQWLSRSTYREDSDFGTGNRK